MRKLLLLVLFLLVLSTSVLAAEILDQQQTQGGEDFEFYVSEDRSHLSVRQEFKPTLTSITKVELKLRLNYPGVAMCRGDNSKINVIIKDAGDNDFAMASNVDLCSLFSNFGNFEWVTIPLTQSRNFPILQ